MEHVKDGPQACIRIGSGDYYGRGPALINAGWKEICVEDHGWHGGFYMFIPPTEDDFWKLPYAEVWNQLQQTGTLHQVVGSYKVHHDLGAEPVWIQCIWSDVSKPTEAEQLEVIVKERELSKGKLIRCWATELRGDVADDIGWCQLREVENGLYYLVQYSDMRGMLSMFGINTAVGTLDQIFSEECYIGSSIEKIRQSLEL